MALRLDHAIVAAACVTVVAGGCRGNKSAEPPVHLQQNMDFQKYYEAQEETKHPEVFKDGRAMRPLIRGTIARGELKESRLFYEGVVGTDADGKPRYADRLPMRLTATTLERGQQRYDIYCAPCHGAAGNGKGIITTRNIRVKPTSYLEPRLLSEPVGYFFHVISNGVRNMNGYAAQIPPSDRWAIAAYVRALQIAGAPAAFKKPPGTRTDTGRRAQ